MSNNIFSDNYKSDSLNDSLISEHLRVTLVKYYEGLLSISQKVQTHKASDNYVINLDWLQFICKCPALFSTYFEDKEGKLSTYEINRKGHSVRMELTGAKNKLYQYHCLIHIKMKGCKKYIPFGVALFEPHKGLNNLQDWYFQIQINNSLLYSNWLQLCNLFLNLTGFSFDHFVRVDVALDSPDTTLLDAVSMVKNSQITRYSSTPTPSLLHHAGKSKIGYSDIGKGYKYQIGAGPSDKKLKIYNKTNEINESSSKLYIANFHKDNLIFDDESIIRYELQMNSNFLNSVPNLMMVRSGGECEKITTEPIGLQQLADGDFLAKLWDMGTNSLIDFRYQPQDSTIKNVAYWEKIQFFNVGATGKKRILNTEQPNNISLYGVKIIIKNLVSQLYTIKIHGIKQKSYLKIIQNQIELYNLQEWYEYRLERWRDELDKKLYLNQDPSQIKWDRIELLSKQAQSAIIS